MAAPQKKTSKKAVNDTKKTSKTTVKKKSPASPKKETLPKKKKKTNTSDKNTSTTTNAVRTVQQVISEKRHEVRRMAAAMTYALLFIPKDMVSQEDKLLPAEISAILVDESDSGCSLVFNTENPMSKYLAAGMRYVIELKGQRPRPG